MSPDPEAVQNTRIVKRRRRASRGRTKALRRSSKHRVRKAGTRRGSKPGRRRPGALRRREETLEVFGRYLAFGGPVLVALVGLVLLMA